MTGRLHLGKEFHHISEIFRKFWLNKADFLSSFASSLLGVGQRSCVSHKAWRSRYGGAKRRKFSFSSELGASFDVFELNLFAIIFF